MTKYTVDHIKETQGRASLIDGENLFAQWAASPTQQVEAEILLYFKEGVGVIAEYHTNCAWKAGPYTEQGEAFHVIPWAYISAIYTEEEYEQMSAMRDADNTLLSYAK